VKNDDRTAPPKFNAGSELIRGVRLNFCGDPDLETPEAYIVDAYWMRARGQLKLRFEHSDGKKGICIDFPNETGLELIRGFLEVT
jgi:hypothetical protein